MALLQGLKVVAVAVVAQAVWGMARTLCPDLPRITIMLAAACFVLFLPTVFGQVSVIALAALMLWKLPPWLVVAGSGCIGYVLSVLL